MKTLSVITAALFLAFGVATSRAQNLERISTATGVPIETLQAERASTGLGWGSLEKAHLLSTLPVRASMMSSRYINLGKAGVKLRTTTDSTSADS